MPEPLKTLVDQMPQADKRGMYCTDIDNRKIDKAIAAIHQGGRPYVEQLIDMLGVPGSPENVKPHYALHCLANHVTTVKDRPGQTALCAVLAEKLAGDISTDNKAYLCQELGQFGRKENVPALAALLLDESLVEPATLALLSIRDGAAGPLRAALPNAAGKCRLNIIHALADLADADSLDTFVKALTDPDREVRLAAAAGLAKLAQPSTIDAMLKATNVDPGWERTQITKSCLVLAENLTAAGNPTAAERIRQHLP